MSELYLLRHGDTGVGDKLVGATDLALAESAGRQLASTRQQLAGIDFCTVACSPLRRCRETAQLLFPGRPVAIWDDLREIDFGQWEMRSFAEIASSCPDQVRAWTEQPLTFTFPGGEAVPAFLARMQAVQQRIATLAAQRLLLITHGGVVRQLLCGYLGIPASKYLVFAVRSGCYAHLTLFSEGGVLQGFNHG